MTARQPLGALLLAALPLGLLLLAWDRPPIPSGLHAIRDLALPLLVAEWIVIAIAFRRHLSPIAAILAWPGAARAALGVVAPIVALSVAMTPGALLLVAMRGMIALSHLLAAVSLLSILSRAERLRQLAILKGLVAGFAILALAAIAYIATFAPTSPGQWGEFGFITRNIRPFGSLMMAGGVFALGASLWLDGRWRHAAGIVAIACLALCFWSGSRGPALASLVAIVAGLIFFLNGGRRDALRHCVGILAASFGAAILYRPEGGPVGLLRLLGLHEKTPGVDVSSGRLDLWYRTLDTYRDMPWVGYGDGRFDLVIGPPVHYFPHNVVLQAWFQWGFIAGTLTLALIAWWGLAAIRNAQRGASPVALPGAMMATSILVGSLVDGQLYDVTTTALFALGAALALVPHRTSAR